MPRKPKLAHESLELGSLPVDAVNRTLNFELDAGDVVLTPGVNAHVLKNHPKDHARCLPHIGSVIGNPLYAGDDFKNEGKFELIGNVRALGEALLIAIEMVKNQDGKYEVRTFYPMKLEKVQNRLKRGHLKHIQRR
nr:hypothetical protein [Azospirillum argentinense]